MPMSPAQRTATGGGVGVLAALAIATPFVAKWEGKRNDPYLDIAGIRTVCYGETANVESRRYGDQECSALLGKSLEKHAKAAEKCIPSGVSSSTRAALYSFAYNAGPAPLCDKTYAMARKLSAGDLWGACAELSRWNRARNPLTHKLEPSKGLTRRREEERALCERGLLR